VKEDFGLRTFIEMNRLLREVAAKALDASLAEQAGEGFSVVTIESYIRRDLERLMTLWPTEVDKQAVVDMLDSLSDNGRGNPSFHYLAEQALRAGGILEDYFASAEAAATSRTHSLLELLEPEIATSSLRQMEQGLLRDAVFNAFVAVFDVLRARTGLDEDGATLVAHALSLDTPRLAMGDLSTTSGQSEQKGFIQLLQGAYLAIINPKAHTLVHDIDERKAKQYLVVASFLARRIKEARQV
jgi:uncharacterized protein (TIGR02391 family)